MIKTELRIGNLVEYPGWNNDGSTAYFKIRDIFFDDNKIALTNGIIQVPCTKMDYINPVELNEKTILKLDFCKDNSENNKTYLSPMFDGNVIKVYFNRFGVAKFQINMHFSIELPYVHTLQNLFFILSRRELVFSNNA